MPRRHSDWARSAVVTASASAEVDAAISIATSLTSATDSAMPLIARDASPAVVRMASKRRRTIASVEAL